MYLLVAILHLEQGLSIGDGELRDHGTGIKNRTMHGDVVPVHLLEDAPILEAPVKGLVARPGSGLHPEVLGGIAIILGALDLVRTANVAVVGLDALARLKRVRQLVVKNLDVCPLPGGVWP